MAIYYLLDDNNDVVMLILEGDDMYIYVDDGIEFVIDDDDNAPCTITSPSTIISTLQMIDDNQFIDSLMNINAGYTTSKTAERIRYEENVHDTTKYHDEMKRMMTAVKKHDTFEVDINDDSEKQYAFTQVLRYIGKNTPS